MNRSLSSEDMKKLAAQEEKRDEVRKQYPNLSTPHVDLVIASKEVPTPANWKTFTLNEDIVIKETPCKVVGITHKDVVLDARIFGLVVRHEIIEITGHKFRVREAMSKYISLRPELGTMRQYV